MLCFCGFGWFVIWNLFSNKQDLGEGNSREQPGKYEAPKTEVGSMLKHGCKTMHMF